MQNQVKASREIRTIMIVSNTAWSLYNFRLGLACALRDSGFRVVMVAPYDEYADRIMQAGFEYRPLEFDNSGTNPYHDIKLFFKLLRLYRSLRPVVILHFTIKVNIYGALAARFLKIPSLGNITGLGTLFLSDNLIYRAARYLYLIALRSPYKVFFQNPADRDLFLRKEFVRPEQVSLLPGSGVNLNNFKPVKVTPKRQYLFVGRLIRDKGIFEFVEAARLLKPKYPQVEFAILGDLYLKNPTAVSKATLDDWIDTGIVRYLGYVDNVQAEMASSECIVLPSYREGLSRVLLEASAMARPIVASDVPGCNDVVDDGVTGFLCEVRSSEDLALKIEKMINLSPNKRTAMGKAGRKKIEQQFDEKIVIRMVIDVVNKALCNSRLI